MLPRRSSIKPQNLVQSTVKEIAKCYLHQQKEAPKNRTWINVEKPSERDLDYCPKSPKCYSHCVEVGPKMVLTPSGRRHSDIARIAFHKTWKHFFYHTMKPVECYQDDPLHSSKISFRVLSRRLQNVTYISKKKHQKTELESTSRSLQSVT